jgi:predicted nucleic acid-binding protein
MRIYIDTSVVGGKFDPEFERRTNPFWDAVINGKVRVILSDLLEKELENAPVHIRNFFNQLPESQIERVAATTESDTLAEQYISAGVVGKTSLDDCQHIALATLVRADVLVSLNFKHIVNIRRIHGYNGVNMLHGYPTIEIRTPDEVINDET